jgi:hypothetical protein
VTALCSIANIISHLPDLKNKNRHESSKNRLAWTTFIRDVASGFERQFLKTKFTLLCVKLVPTTFGFLWHVFNTFTSMYVCTCNNIILFGLAAWSSGIISASGEMG